MPPQKRPRGAELGVEEGARVEHFHAYSGEGVGDRAENGLGVLAPELRQGEYRLQVGLHSLEELFGGYLPRHYRVFCAARTQIFEKLSELADIRAIPFGFGERFPELGGGLVLKRH